MIVVDMICSQMLLELQSFFPKPIDPKWSYKVDVDSQQYGFMWKKRKPISKMFGCINNVIIHAQGNASEDNGVPILKLKVCSNLQFKWGGVIPMHSHILMVVKLWYGFHS